MCLPARLGDRNAGQSGHRALDDLLQLQPSGFIPWRHPARRVLSADDRNNPTRSEGEKSSLIYPEMMSKGWGIAQLVETLPRVWTESRNHIAQVNVVMAARNL
jgi:hypothetical protein